MAIERATGLGNINVSEEALASLAGGVVTECYGVVGMASQKIFIDGIAELLRKENYSKGVIIKKSEEGIELDVYIIVSFGVKISEVISEVQKKVKYVLEKTLEIDPVIVNVYVQGVKVID